MSKNAVKLPDIASLTARAHGLMPVEYKVVVRPEKAKDYVATKTGVRIYKPDETKERDDHASMEGELVAIAPHAFTYEEWPENARKPMVGDHVIFARYSGITVEGNDGVEYRLMNDKDIVAVRGRR